jgi:outer membrane protein TolC
MASLALEAALKHSEQYDELKKAQVRLEQARNDYELGVISRADYISATEGCINTIRSCSPTSRS